VFREEPSTMLSTTSTITTASLKRPIEIPLMEILLQSPPMMTDTEFLSPSNSLKVFRPDKEIIIRDSTE